jgi:TolB protein
VTIRAGVPVFDTGREEFTKSMRGSWDMRPQWDVDGEGLFFDSDRTNSISNIWYKRRDARGYTQLTTSQVNAWGPTVSKDGNKVAYQVANSENKAGWSIWVMDRDGRSATELGEGEEPAFSPDGKKLAFTATDAKGSRQIWVMDTSGGNRVQITNENDNHKPVWHPSGKKLVFVSNRAENDDVWMSELDSPRMVQLTNYFGDDTDPEFTPDGRYLLFASTRGGGDYHHIWMGEISGGGE